MPSLSQALPLVATFALTLGWLTYFRWKDRHRPEPWRLVAVAVGGGGAAVPLALLGYHGFDALGAPSEWSVLVWGPWPTALGQALLIGLVEEGAKLVPILPIALGSRHFDEPLDGFVYSAFSALGFAAVETTSLWLGSGGPMGLALVQAATGPITHALFSAPAGLGLARTVLGGQRAAWALGLGASVALHGAYDLLIARPQSPSWAPAVLVLAIWLWFLRATPLLAAQAPKA